MAIRFKYQPAAAATGLAAYASGSSKARERATERSLKIWQDEQDKQARREELVYRQNREDARTAYREEANQQRDKRRDKRQFKYGQKIEGMRQEGYQERERRRQEGYDNRHAMDLEADRQAEIEEGLQNHSLVLTGDAKEDIRAARAKLAKDLQKPDLDEAARAEAIEKMNRKIQQIRSYGAIRPESEDDPNQAGLVWNDEKGYVPPKRGQRATHSVGPDGIPVPTEEYAERESKRRETEADLYLNALERMSSDKVTGAAKPKSIQKAADWAENESRRIYGMDASNRTVEVDADGKMKPLPIPSGLAPGEDPNDPAPEDIVPVTPTPTPAAEPTPAVPPPAEGFSSGVVSPEPQDAEQPVEAKETAAQVRARRYQDKKAREREKYERNKAAPHARRAGVTVDEYLARNGGLPAGLPAGSKMIGKDTFRLPDGRIIRRRR